MLNLLFTRFSLNCLVFRHYKASPQTFVILTDHLQRKKKEIIHYISARILYRHQGRHFCPDTAFGGPCS